MTAETTPGAAGDRLAKIIARSGLCSRRDAEGWIKDGRVNVNGKIIRTPAFNVTDRDKIMVDGAPLAAREGTRVWLYHKPAGLVVTEKDPEGRETIFEKLSAEGLPRVVTIGRLDINTEGLLLLTNDGGLKRVLELPATGWLRRYRVRAHGTVTQAALDGLKAGTEIDGIKYGPIEATLEREQGANVWLQVGLREGKNREVKNVLAALGLQVNRLIRISYGPFQLGEIPIGAVEAVKARILRDQLGTRLAEQAGADFVSSQPMARPVRERETGRGTNTVEIGKERFRFADRPDGERSERGEEPPRRDRPGRPELRRPVRRPKPEEPAGPTRQIHFDDGRESTVFEAKHYGKPPKPDFKAARSDDAGKRPFGDKPGRTFADKKPRGPDDKPRRDFGDRPRRDDAGDRPKRAYAGKPAYAAKPAGKPADRPNRFDKGDRPARPESARPARAGAARPPRDGGDRPRPTRDFGDRPRTARAPAPAESRTSRPASADRPPRKPYAKPSGPRSGPADGPRPVRARAGDGPGGKPAAKRNGAAPMTGRGNRKDGVSRGAPRKPASGKPGRPPRTRA